MFEKCAVRAVGARLRVAALVAGDAVELDLVVELDALRADEDGLARARRRRRHERAPRARNDRAVALDRRRAEQHLGHCAHCVRDRVQREVRARHARLQQVRAERLRRVRRPRVHAQHLESYPLLHAVRCPHGVLSS